MIWLLACTADLKDSAPESMETESARESGDSVRESVPDSEGDVEAGPDCAATDWPIETAFNVLGDRLVRGVASDQDVADLDTLLEVLVPVTPGPWEHRVVGPFVSEDGLNFSDSAPTVWNQGSVPEAVVGPAGDLWVFFVDGNLDRLRDAAVARQPVGPGLRGFGGLSAVVQGGDGSFSEVELSFSGEVPLYVVDPDLVRGEDGVYRLYFLGMRAQDMCADTPDPFIVPGGHSMYLATSTDLVNWESHGPVFQATVGGTDPAVWCVSEQVCYALMQDVGESEDGGMSFAPGSLGLPGGVQLPDVHATESGWRMYFLDGMGLGSRVSGDGVNWTDAGLTSVEGSSPSAYQTNGETRLFISTR